MRHDIADHPAAQQLNQKIERSLVHPEKRGFRTRVLNSFCDVTVTSPGGIYLGKAPGYNVDMDRIHRVLMRITAGLHFHELRRRVPSNRQVIVRCTEDFAAGPPERRASVIEFMHAVTQNPMHRVGEDVFDYWFALYADDQTFNAWVLRFYMKLFFLCMVVSP